MYRIARPLLFRLDAERAHDLAMGALAWSSRHPGALRLLDVALATRDPRLSVDAFGVRFPNPVGLAAGMDKNARAVPAFLALGFGSVEVGSVTAEAQAGNPRPRMFRLADDRALINRMGFNNEGARTVAARMSAWRAEGALEGPVGVNVGKSRSVPLERAREDYAASLVAAWDVADYLVVNVSSPNTPGLRALQEATALNDLLELISECRSSLGHRPVLLKIAPDLDPSQLDGIVDAAERHGLDGLVATNTTTSRSSLRHDPDQAGGLSGQPLASASLAFLRALRERTELPLISVGGVASAADVVERMRLGADLVQLYTSLVYQGPGLVGRICRDLLRGIERAGAPSLAAWVEDLRETA